MTPRTRSAPNKPISPTDDNNGDLATRSQSVGDSWSYAFNARNELTQVVKNAQAQATFTYDPAGRRLSPSKPRRSIHGGDLNQCQETAGRFQSPRRFIQPIREEPWGEEGEAIGNLEGHR